MSVVTSPPLAAPKRRRYVRAVGPRLRVLLYGIFALVALLGANSAYLVSITLLEWARGYTIQNYFYQYMFLAHLVLGFLLVLPFVVFGVIHIRNTWNRPNRRAVQIGYLLFFTSLAVLGTGVALTRMEVPGYFNLSIKKPGARTALYWAHVILPLAAVWLYILHRLAGPRIKWRV